jgi:cell wall assembly regulator SMI1
MTSNWQIGDRVRLVAGMGAGMDGEITAIRPHEQAADVQVEIWGRRSTLKVSLASCALTARSSSPADPPPATIDQILDRLDRWVRANLPAVHADLPAAATEAEIAAAEQVIGRRFPDDVRAVYARMNGTPACPVDSDGFPRATPATAFWDALFDGEGLMTVAAAAEAHGFFQSLKGDWITPARLGFWSPEWIPLVANGCGDWLCVDTAGTWTGVAGQLVWLYHDSESRPIIAGSLADFLTARVEDLESGAVPLVDGALPDRPKWRDVPGYSLFASARFAPLVPKVRRIEFETPVRVIDPASSRFGQTGIKRYDRSGSWLVTVDFEPKPPMERGEEFQLAQLEPAV